MYTKVSADTLVYMKISADALVFIKISAGTLVHMKILHFQGKMSVLQLASITLQLQ